MLHKQYLKFIQEGKSIELMYIIHMYTQHVDEWTSLKEILWMFHFPTTIYNVVK